MREGRAGCGRVRVQAGPRGPESRPGALSLQRCRCGSWATEPCHAIPRKPIWFSSHQSWTKPDLGSVQRHNRARLAAPVRANHAPGRNSYHWRPYRGNPQLIRFPGVAVAGHCHYATAIHGHTGGVYGSKRKFSGSSSRQYRCCQRRYSRNR